MGMWGVVGWLQVTGDGALTRAAAHARFPDTMLQGASAVARESGAGWLGLVFGLLEIGLLGSCLLLSVRLGRAGWGWLVLIGALHALAFIAMYTADLYYMRGELQTIVFGFPLPTALMLYGVGGVPLLFAVLYVVRFDGMILTAEDAALVEQIVRDRRQHVDGPVQ